MAIVQCKSWNLAKKKKKVMEVDILWVDSSNHDMLILLVYTSLTRKTIGFFSRSSL